MTVARLERNQRQSEIKQKGFEKFTCWLLVYPVSQAADIAAFKRLMYLLVMIKPMLEQTREIVRDFNRIYDTETLVKPELMLPPKARDD